MRIEELQTKKIILWTKKKRFAKKEYGEKDLSIESIIEGVYSNDYLKENLIFKGGTALHKSYLQKNLRFSEDIDLNQRYNVPLEQLKKEMEQVLQSIGFPLDTHFLDTPYGMIFYARYFSITKNTEDYVKIDVNCNEHFNLLDFKKKKLHLNNPYISKTIDVITYDLNELVGQKICALFERSKGRDLMDVYHSSFHPDFNLRKAIQSAYFYATYIPTYSLEGHDKANKRRSLRKKMGFEKKALITNLIGKEKNPKFINDIIEYSNKGMDVRIKEGFEWTKDVLVNEITKTIPLIIKKQKEKDPTEPGFSWDVF